MKWGYIISEVVVWYAKLVVVYLTYLGAKEFTATNRTSSKPPITERLWVYLRCIAFVALFALVTAGTGTYVGDDEDEYHLVSIDYSRGMIVFIVLAVAVLFGAAEGYGAPNKYPPTRSDDF